MKEKILVIIFMLIIFSVFTINMVIDKKDISIYERRKLATFPEITLKGLLNKEATNDIENYVADHFILRDNLRGIKTNIEFLLNKSDVNDLFYYKDHYFKYEGKYNERQVNKFSQKINYIYDNYLQGMTVYYSVIPEKNYYLDSNKYKKFNYENLFDSLESINKDITYIDITSTINIDSFYYTDHHLRQDKILPIIEKLASVMDFNFVDDYNIQIYEPFYGSYYGQLPFKKSGEKIYVLKNSVIENATVYNIENKYNKVYNYDKFGTVDSYDIFLSGATPYLEITNNNIDYGKELIIFRDSYTSSIAPLMLSGYKKITLLDLRYGNLKLLLDKIELNNQDILFLYSTSLINGSDVLKVF